MFDTAYENLPGSFGPGTCGLAGLHEWSSSRPDAGIHPHLHALLFPFRLVSTGSGFEAIPLPPLRPPDALRTLRVAWAEAFTHGLDLLYERLYRRARRGWSLLPLDGAPDKRREAAARAFLAEYEHVREDFPAPERWDTHEEYVPLLMPERATDAEGRPRRDGRGRPILTGREVSAVPLLRHRINYVIRSWAGDLAEQAFYDKESAPGEKWKMIRSAGREVPADLAGIARMSSILARAPRDHARRSPRYRWFGPLAPAVRGQVFAFFGVEEKEAPPDDSERVVTERGLVVGRTADGLLLRPVIAGPDPEAEPLDWRDDGRLAPVGLGSERVVPWSTWRDQGFATSVIMFNPTFEGGRGRHRAGVLDRPLRSFEVFNLLRASRAPPPAPESASEAIRRAAISITNGEGASAPLPAEVRAIIGADPYAAARRAAHAAPAEAAA